MQSSNKKFQFLVPKDSSPAATKRLLNEWTRFGLSENRKSKNYQCSLKDNNLYKWSVSISNHFLEPFSTQLFLYASKFGVYDVVIELLFESTYPMVPPKVRLIEPRIFPGSIAHIGPGGSIQTPLLKDSSLSIDFDPSSSNWTPVCTIDTIINDLISLINRSCSSFDETSNFRFFDVLNRNPFLASESDSERFGFLERYQVVLFNDIDVSTGGKISLPASALEKIANSSRPEFPLIFELKQTIVKQEYDDVERSTNNLSKTVAGVSTFDMQEGFVMIPTWIAENMEVNDGDIISVRMARLKKGELLKLRPLEPEKFISLEQPKESLESSLRAYVALQTGDTISIPFENGTQKFIVVETRPSNSIAINDVDLKLEIEMPKNFDVDSHLQSINSKQNNQDIIEEHSKDILYNYSGSNNQLDNENSIICSNCDRHVPKPSIHTHEAFCRRNNYKCDICAQVIRISDTKAHFDQVHRIVKCSCGIEVEIRNLSIHKQKDCLHKPFPCRYCNLKKRIIDLPEHEEYCGSRTEKCQKCQKFVLVKQLETHQASNCNSSNIDNQTEPIDLISKVKGFFSFTGLR